MNYTDIKELALSYADREDPEVIDRIDNFIEIVEARINRQLKVGDLSNRAIIDLDEMDIEENQEYFGLPPDFGGLRTIEMQTSDTLKRRTMKYINPEQMSNLVTSVANSKPGTQVYYSIVAQQLQINPPQDTGVIEILYYQKLVPLTAAAPTNWLGDINPDCYVFGILVEIGAFTKDKDAAELWDIRFRAAVEEIDTEDAENRWSGPPLEMKLG